MRLLARKVFTIILLTSSLFRIPSAHAKVMTFTKEYTYQASEADSKLSCRAIALEQIKRLLLEQLGTYLESQTEVINFQLSKDQITSLTAGIVHTEVNEEKWDGQSYWLKAQIVADPDEVSTSIDKLRKDREKSKELDQTRKRADESSKEIEKLKKQITMLTGVDPKLQQHYNGVVNKLSAEDWFQKGLIAQYRNSNESIAEQIIWDNERYGHINKRVEDNIAIDSYTHAITLNPIFARAYHNRGMVYDWIGQYAKAIDDFKATVNLTPNDVLVYNNMGNTYFAMKQYDNSIASYTKALSIDTNLSNIYINRGNAYSKQNKRKKAIEDYQKACKMGNKDGCARLSKLKQ